MVIDAWNQIAHPDFIKGVPEVSRLLLQSKMPLAWSEKGLTPKQTIQLMDKADVNETKQIYIEIHGIITILIIFLVETIKAKTVRRAKWNEILKPL
ncbi:16656_t:CDS:2 [Entrophospora sp. SA101]|nr:16656_t:CDS:2 [Entrophospora sp. SA101]